MIVVTGGAGFIGSCFVRELNERNIMDILVVDRLGTGVKWKNLVGKRFSNVEHKDVFRKKLLAGGYGAEIEAIYHLGACSATTEIDADYLLDNNYKYSRDLAEYAEKRNIRFIYASSAATYGAGEQGYTDTVYETLKPLNMYGYSKHLFDQWVLQSGLAGKVVGVKFFNVFGPNEYHKGEMASLVFKAYRQIVETGKLRLFKSYKLEYADGEQQRDFVYVKDCTSAMANLLKYGEVTGIYNLGSGKARSWNDLARAVFAAMERPLNIEYVEMPEYLRPQYQYFTQADMTKLQQTRVYQPPTGLEDAVCDYVQEYLAQETANY
jgi:ADP-L-glycero-D-manno-heptose 6-epimerase